MHMRSRRTTALLGAILSATVVVALSACTPTAPTATSGATTGASSSAAPVSTPTPTAVALAPPKVRVPLTCDQVAPTALITAALGSNVVTHTNDAGDLTPYAYVQDGALYCSYDGTVAKSETEFQLIVMPDITPKHWADYKTYLKDGSTIASPFGANSYVDCESSPADLKCNLDMLIGTTWLSIEDFSDNVPSSMTVAAALARFKPLLQTAVTAVQGATIAEPLWTDPDATAVNISDGLAFENVVKAASGVNYRTEVYNPDPIAVGPQSEAMYPTGYQIFGGGGGKFGISINVLPGGLWAVPAVMTAGSSLSGYTTVAGLGDQAFSFSETDKYEPYEIQLFVVKGHNLVSVEVDTSSKSAGTNVATVAKNVATGVLGQIN